MSRSIQVSSATVNALHPKWPQAYRKDDRRLGRRTTVLSDRLGPQVAIPGLCERWRLRASGLYDWQRALRLHGLDSFVSRPRGGRRPQVPPRQQKRLGERMAAGPLGVGCEPAWWDVVLLRGLRWRECGGLYNRQDGGIWLPTLGGPCTRPGWWRNLSARPRASPGWHSRGRRWSERLHVAMGSSGGKLRPGLRRGVPCVTRGRQPEVPPRGQRQGYTVVGALAYCSGRLFSQGLEGRFHAESSQAFFQLSMAHTPPPLFWLHAGARYHPSASPQAVLAAPRPRLTAEPLPSYAPDDHPIAYLWPKTQKRATHNHYFKAFAMLTASVDKALAYFAMPSETGLCLFGLYCEESGLALKQAASLSKSKPEHL